MSDDRARAYLIETPGIGRWTADIYLLSCMGRTDPWPAADVALQAAVAHALELPARPSERDMDALAEVWRPCRGVAARLFWAHYRMHARALKTHAGGRMIRDGHARRRAHDLGYPHRARGDLSTRATCPMPSSTRWTRVIPTSAGG